MSISPLGASESQFPDPLSLVTSRNSAQSILADFYWFTRIQEIAHSEIMGENAILLSGG